MKREFLEGLGLEKEDIDKIMTENGKAIEKFKTDNENQGVKITELESKLSEANGEIQSYKAMDIEGIKAKASEWETKYNTDKVAWDREKQDRIYMDTVNTQLENIKFSSNAAKESVIGKIKEKNLSIDDGKLLGFEDFIKTLKEQDSGAFSEAAKGPTIDYGVNLGSGGNIDSDVFISASRSGAGLKEKE